MIASRPRKWRSGCVRKRAWPTSRGSTDWVCRWLPKCAKLFPVWGSVPRDRLGTANRVLQILLRRTVGGLPPYTGGFYLFVSFLHVSEFQIPQILVTRHLLASTLD